ncbi:MAG TPA: hypothetical protein VHV08_03440, partial [Pirellulales bacterium]|nr:hypothetical protein [Pirellulales bacterium]
TKSIKWNFTKFLVDRNGRVVSRFAPTATIRRLEKAIVPLLAEHGSRPILPTVRTSGTRP